MKAERDLTKKNKNKRVIRSDIWISIMIHHCYELSNSSHEARGYMPSVSSRDNAVR
jgi:hypothetical protein